MIEYTSFRYEKFVAIRYCRKCNGIDHTEEYCRTEDRFKQVVEAWMCEEKGVWYMCLEGTG